VAGFAAPDEQAVSDASLGLGRQGQESVVEKAPVEGRWDGPPPAPKILDAGLQTIAVHEAPTRAECHGGVVNGLRCGRHDNLLSRPSRDVGERGMGTHAKIKRSILDRFCPSDA